MPAIFNHLHSLFTFHIYRATLSPTTRWLLISLYSNEWLLINFRPSSGMYRVRELPEYSRNCKSGRTDLVQITATSHTPSPPPSHIRSWDDKKKAEPHHALDKHSQHQFSNNKNEFESISGLRVAWHIHFVRASRRVFLACARARSTHRKKKGEKLLVQTDTQTENEWGLVCSMYIWCWARGFSILSQMWGLNAALWWRKIHKLFTRACILNLSSNIWDTGLKRWFSVEPFSFYWRSNNIYADEMDGMFRTASICWNSSKCQFILPKSIINQSNR